MESKDSLYSYYTAKGIKSGLTFKDSEFLLNDKPFQIFGGSLHYFRLFPNQWEVSIKKMYHCHLNTVCTYVPWNLHEDKPGVFDFTHILDLKSFIEMVQKQDMFLILRVGPYICAEIDFGGLPSWLLKDKNMKLRTNYPPYLEAIKNFFTELVNLIYKYQFSVSGGPIIAIQIENEFGSYGNTQVNKDDFEYMIFLKTLLTDLGIKELLFTCDFLSMSSLKGSIPNVLMTANFQTDPEKELGVLKQLQPNKPLMVAELWSGWFDHWGEKHEEVSVEVYIESLKTILNLNASFNIYVFQGGTNFGFINGANIGFPLPESSYSTTVTSYDYGALLTEAGEYTEKYFATMSVLKLCKKNYRRPDFILDLKHAYLKAESLPLMYFLPLNEVLPLTSKFVCLDPVVMEECGSDYGQRFGFSLYETKFDRSGNLEFCVTRGVRTIILVNSHIISVIEQSYGFQKVYIEHSFQERPSTLWILTENLGRINFTERSEILNNERRGIFETVMLDKISLRNWNAYNLDFNKKLVYDISTSLNWKCIDNLDSQSPIGLYRAMVNLNDVKDTFIYSSSWNKGIVIVNDFNIGRYWRIGPQQTLFLPSELLKRGFNDIIVFELHSKISDLKFNTSHVLDITKLSIT